MAVVVVFRARHAFYCGGRWRGYCRQLSWCGREAIVASLYGEAVLVVRILTAGYYAILIKSYHCSAYVYVFHELNNFSHYGC